MSNATGTSVDCGQSEADKGVSRLAPEEGHRLMRSFFSISEPSLRQAIIKLVTELSGTDDETSALQRLSRSALTLHQVQPN